MLYTILLFAIVTCGTSQKIVTDYPTLPTLWEAETIEPGAPGSGKGIEAYSFVEKPTEDTPSAMCSNYTDCQRLIYVENNYNAKRYLLGCDAVDCCWEPQDGNQVEFQIPNVYYTNPSKNVDIYYQRANVTNFGETIEADEWSWSWTIQNKLSQDWRAYTLPCEECVNGVKLIQWQSRAMGLEWYPIQFKGYKGYDLSSDEGKNFLNMFEVPDICKKNNLLECTSGLHDKYFGKNQDNSYKNNNLKSSDCGTCGTGYQACCIGFAIDGYPCDCHLQDGGSGKSGSNCGDCGTAYSACCIGYEADGYPCQCDVM